MIAPSFNFDLGIKNYQKNRLIVDRVHIKNEIMYNIEKTKKTVFSISAFSYVNKDNRSFLETLRDLDASNLLNTFHFYINTSGNVFTNLEMSSESFFYPNATNEFNIVICFSGKRSNLGNFKQPLTLYNNNQIKTFSEFIKVFYNNAFDVKFNNLDVDNNFDKISNLGFDLENYAKEELASV
jgi:hypothetical protein